MVRTADVTVLATVLSGRFGQRWVYSEPGEEYWADVEVLLELRVDEVLAGEVGDGSDRVTMSIGPFDTSEMTKFPWKPFIGRQAVFALRRSGTEVTNDWGTRPEDPAVLARNSHHVIYSKGLLERGPNGLTRSPWADKSGWTPKIERRPFEDVLASIRAAEQ